MADPKPITILFLAAASYATVPPQNFEAGSLHEMRPDLANRWLSRGLATADPDRIAEARAATKKPAPEESVVIPKAWRTLPLPVQGDLAAKLGAPADVVADAAKVGEFIAAAELARRAGR